MRAPAAEVVRNGSWEPGNVSAPQDWGVRNRKCGWGVACYARQGWQALLLEHPLWKTA